MSLVLADRVRQTSTTTGSGTLTLDGSVTGFQSFAAIGDGNTTYYTITLDAQWEVGIGTYSAGTLTRDTIISSSTGSKIVFGAGAKDVFVTLPSQKAVTSGTDATLTKLTTPTVQAANSGGLSLKNSAGTTQISMGAGGGDNVSVNVSTNMNGSNSQIDISPTGTGHVHIKPSGTGSIEVAPTNVGTIDNMTIGATTPKAVTGTTITATSFFGSGSGLTSIPNSALTNSVITINGVATSLGGSANVGTVTSASIVSANGFAGTVATDTTTPAITLSTSITGVLKGNGTAISAASAGTDYQAPITLTTIGTSGAATFVSNTLNIPQYSSGGGSVTSVAATVPTFLSLTGSPITTSGTLAISYSGTALPIANGGSGEITAQLAMNAFAGAVTSGSYLRGNGTNVVMATIQAADVPTLNQNTTGTASNVTGTVAVANGGTGLTTTPANGALDIGNGTGFTRATLTAGTGISVTNASGSITIAATNSGTVTSVTGTSPVVSSGGATPAISLAASYGDTQNPYASKTANYVLAAPNGTAGVPTFRAIVAADIPTLNQNTTGNAATATTTTNIAGGTNLQIPFNTGAGATSFIVAPTIGSTFLQYNGTGFTWAAAAGIGTVTSVAATVPSFLSITGSPITTAGTLAISYSGTALPIANGGTGQTTASAAFNALSPITTTGDLIIGNGTNSATRLAIGTNGYVLTSNGTTASWAAGGGGGGLAWQSVQTANFTAVSGNAYPINTTAGIITVTLPASPSAGNFVCLTDYAGTFAINNLAIAPNGSNLDGAAGTAYIQIARSSIHLVYIDATQGWIPYSGFNTQTPAQAYSIDYLVVAGGAGAGGIQVGSGISGGGGAGGYLTNTATVNIGTAYTVTIGAGGSGGAATGQVGFSGSTSSFNSTAPVGGGGGSPGRDTNIAGVSGGSGGGGGGGGGGSGTTAGSGTSGQGNAGGAGFTSPNYGSGGGGGASAVGAAGTSAGGGNGGAGLNWQSLGTFYAGGGGGASYNAGGTQGTGGAGGGGNGSNTGAGNNATVNTGGGGGGTGKDNTGAVGGNGGSGIVIIRYSGSQRGTGGTVTSAGGYTYHTFTASSTYSG